MKKHYLLTKFTLLLLLMVTAWQGVYASDFKTNRTDFRDESIYFLMTTRFYDGDPKNNVLCWDNQEAQKNTKDPCWRGDFQGVVDKLDYIKALGFTAIWITPIVQNASGYDYHGYHAMDFTKVDSRYESSVSQGSSKDCDFQTLIDAAHAKGIKIVLDIVLNHTGNFGEATLKPLFTRDTNIRNQASAEHCLVPNEALLGSDYASLQPGQQYQRRLAHMKNTDGQNHDNRNFWHHVGSGWNWDEPSRWWGQIAGDCVDLNTENDAVARYLVDCYGTFIKMGVDGFRIDTSGHISRLTFNKVFIPQFAALGEQYKEKRRLAGSPEIQPFFMFGEVCARFGGVTYRDQPNLSSYYYTWKSSDALLNSWNSDATWWDNQVVKEGAAPLGNMTLCLQEANVAEESDNTFMRNGAYHEPDYSRSSGFNVIDFPLHYNFSNAGSAFGLAAGGDKYYNDATFNVVYVDSHDYGPQPNDGVRFSGSDAQWAENLSLMFTFRGVPCIYYGSEIGFRRGSKIDNGPNGPLSDTGRAYFGGYIKGDVSATDFGVYTAGGNAAATLSHNLAQHLIRLNRIRQAVPALRKGQWTSDGCKSNGGIAFKRAYKNSYALVALNGGATFTGCPAGTYTDVVTGQQYSGSTITVNAPSNQGQVRVLVKDWTGGVIGKDGAFIYASSAQGGGTPSWDGTQEEGASFWHDGTNPIVGAAVKLSPEGGTFKTETLTVTATLNETAVSGWYRIGEGAKINIAGTSAQFTIGEGMNYGESVTVSWGATDADGKENNGSADYKKVDPNATITIYVSASKAPNLYAWTGESTALNGAWPGGKMSTTTTVEGKTYFYHTFSDVESVNVIFNNGSGGAANQTADITGITSDAYYTWDGGSGYTVVNISNGGNNGGENGGGENGGGSGDTGEIAAYFVNNSLWSTVYCWAWIDNGANFTGGSWPGTPCVKTGEKSIDGYDIWKWTYTGTETSAPQKIIFNNGGAGSQTADLLFTNGGYYKAEGLITGIQQAEADQPVGPFKVYNLQGMVVAVAGSLDGLQYTLRPGIYIINGKKYLIK